MAITPSWESSTEATEVEYEYIDKGAVTMPQTNPAVMAKYKAGLDEAAATDKVEWPTSTPGSTAGF